jgi:hypothetical protein
LYHSDKLWLESITGQGKAKDRQQESIPSLLPHPTRDTS